MARPDSSKEFGVADNDSGNILDDLVAKAKDLGEQVKEFAEDAFDNVKEFASDTVEKGQHAFEDIKDRLDGDDDTPAADPAGDGVDPIGDPADPAGDPVDPAGTPDDPSAADTVSSAHDVPVSDSVEDAADELSTSAEVGSLDDAEARGSSGEADPSPESLPGDDAGDLNTSYGGDVGESGVNDFGSTVQPVDSFGDTEASALDAPPEGPDADTSKPLS